VESDLMQRAVGGDDRRALARLLRIVEDRGEGWSDLLAEAWARPPAAHLVGITGAPGSGKSTLTSALIDAWRTVDRRVAVVAVDPSSPFSGGALLGDRIRMQSHVSDPGVFVRSMSSRGRLGGVADATAGLVTVFDAARFDPVVVETVGVGQSEVDIVDHTDTVVVVVTPGWGDGVQADKAGILEIGDVFVINKADRPEVAETRRWLTSMLEMSPPRSGWDPPVVETVATEDAGIDELVGALDHHRRHLVTGAEGAERRRRRAEAYVEWAVAAGLQRQMQKPTVAGIVDEVMARRLDPWAAARRLIDGLG
jgi:LAO/AO transport system kinase